VSSELETRVTTLEAQVARLQEDGVATRSMAALADREVADVRATDRATRSLLHALRETQVEQGQAITGIAGAVGALATQVDALGAHLGALSGQVADLAEGQTRHEQTLTQHGQLLAEILSRLPPPA
jgi:uncharacterized coiled-coil protein SlyX